MACSTIRIVFERSYLRLRSVYMLSPAGAGLRRLARTIPRARGLALGYTLSPAGAGLRGLPRTRYPGLADSPWTALFRPLARACGGLLARYPGLADSPWATLFRPLARACGAYLARATQGSQTRPGLHSFARWRGLAERRYDSASSRTCRIATIAGS
jgi:hypothetical protein